MRKSKPYVYKKHATRAFQQFWDVKHKVYSGLSFLKFQAQQGTAILVIDHTGRDITKEVLSDS